MEPSNVVCDGPPDELVRVRFTFSRKGSRSSGFCTPNGVTGAFSPAVELERTLEAMDLEPEQPVPLLDLPLSSRLEEEEAIAGEAVFLALQDCIDIVVSNEVARIEREVASTQTPHSALVTGDSSETLGSVVACEEVVAPDGAALEEESVAIASEPNSAVVGGETEPECDDINDIPPDQPDPTGLNSGAHEPTEELDDEVGSDKGERSGSFEGEGNPDASDPSRPPDPPEEPSDAFDGHDEEQVEASDDYGGDFDDAEEHTEENDAKDPDPSTQDTPAHPEPTEALDDEYDDDQQYEPDEEDNPSTQDHYEAQYDDDLDPETPPAPQDPDLDQSYSDDGFTDDA
ncbi:hypothetical protein Poli38472_002355 [Pythium oligandrum]|uniref:Uncharacterized protein n=1 Tax=Pythium oligandrum TaxID=41045 RepID=A0A8K1CH15_PYTOL|nr:hypothetical protein Poli38472_002355 [Pythium oligandrum]|eukprot:TMW63414.1 hypothetical protein Poli38472_002355 [Pythium oligandrum]